MAKKTETGEAGKEIVAKTDAEIKKSEPTFSERFTNMVIHEFTGNVGNLELTAFQKRLIQNYFISTDISLKIAEERRLRKKEQYRDPLPITWANVNMESLALNVVACAKIGFDPALPNHINMVPYKNNKTNKYDVGFIEGYRGKELKAKKYGYEMPTHVIVELVYSNDKFIPIKRDQENDVETYKFKISEDPFNRGEIVGGFYYHEFNEPSKNKLMFYNIHEIEKRKPEYASTEFWGGEKPTYGEDGKKTGKETVEGWYAEMCWKTLYRLAYNAITIDSEKIDDNLMRIIENEKLFEANREPNGLDNSMEASRRQIEQGANKEEIKITEATVVSDDKTNEQQLTQERGAKLPGF